jgi:hypothetical protein
MAVLMTMDIPIARAHLEAVSAAMGVQDDPPDGIIAHVLTETSDGVHVVDIWESQADFQKFNDDGSLPCEGSFRRGIHGRPSRPPSTRHTRRSRTIGPRSGSRADYRQPPLHCGPSTSGIAHNWRTQTTQGQALVARRANGILASPARNLSRPSSGQTRETPASAAL